ncbi:nucleotidyltransferase family protein [Brachybacterium saurashtrense]|uniref:Nucleotidyltransferase family protein n=2 Tax=Brachybacterium saurashtrense TaxID=556288 RepID=A0A345YQL3_9MICO|nr:nucleotidyltransferase family protein [Brachybacterium saurashtrense]RRR23955.1 nucleotidyltransferase family protein [Brachybacterium saurashtrense]
MIETAVVLARGLGSRMRTEGGAGLTAAQSAAAASGHKALMPIGEHRLIDYSLSALADAGIRRAVLVVAPQHEEFSQHLAALAPSRLRVELAVQAEPRGTADAVASAREVVGEESFVMVNGDNLYPREGIARLRQAERSALLGFERAALVEHSNIAAERIAAFALIEHRDGLLERIVEKPDAAVLDAAGPDALVSMNAFAFTPEIFAACERIEPSPRGELEIVDAVRELDEVAVLPFAGGVLDLSRRDDVEGVQRRLAEVEVVL